MSVKVHDNLDDLQAAMGAKTEEEELRPGTTAESMAALNAAANAFGAAIVQGIAPAIQAAVKATEEFLYQVNAIEGTKQWRANKARYERRYKNRSKNK